MQSRPTPAARVYVMHASPSHSIRKTPRNVAIHQFPRACLRLISSRSMKLLLLHVPISADCSVHAYFGPTENKLTELQLPDRQACIRTKYTPSTNSLRILINQKNTHTFPGAVSVRTS
jgi:hypothetical protein